MTEEGGEEEEWRHANGEMSRREALDQKQNSHRFRGAIFQGHGSSKLLWPQRSCLLISSYGLAPGRVGGSAPPLRLAVANCLVYDRGPVRQTLDPDLCGSTEYMH